MRALIKDLVHLRGLLSCILCVFVCVKKLSEKATEALN